MTPSEQTERRPWWVWEQHKLAHYCYAPSAEEAARQYAKDQSVPFGASVHVSLITESYEVVLIERATKQVADV